MSSYPKNYEYKDTVSDYVKLKPGKTRVRVLTDVIVGYEAWESVDGKRHPIRFKTFEEAVADPRAEQIKEFHAFIVWDYEEQMVRLLNVTQKGIQKTIYSQTLDEDWEDLTSYDVVITRVGTTMDDTEYSVVFKLPKPMAKEIKDAFALVSIQPDEYFNDGHPIVRKEAPQHDSVGDVEDISQEVDPDDVPYL